MDNGYTYEIIKNGKTTITINVSILPNKFDAEKERQYARLSKKVEIKGFRVGKAPKNMIETKLGTTLYEETIRSLVKQVTHQILIKENFRLFGDIMYDILKYEPKKNLEYKIKFNTYPQFDLPDFKKLNVAKEKVQVTSEEINNFINELEKNIQKDSKHVKKIQNITDEWVKSQKIPNVNNVKEFKDFAKKFILQQKERQNEQKFIKDIINASIKLVNIEIPSSIIEKELEYRSKHHKERLANLGIKWEQWLKLQKTDEEKLRKSWQDEITRDLKIFFLLSAVIEKNNITTSIEEIDTYLGVDKNTLDPNKLNEKRSQITELLLEKKAIDWIIEKVEKK